MTGIVENRVRAIEPCAYLTHYVADRSIAKIFIFLTLVFTLLLTGCGGGGGESPTNSPVNVQNPAIQNPIGNTANVGGLIPLPTSEYLALRQISPRLALAGSLPEAVDLTDKFPKPGNQGSQSSCVAWAVGYATKSYQEALDHNWDVNTHTFSPSFIYNQINGGKDQGSTFPDALNLLVNQGSVLLEDMPYLESDWTTQPTDAIRGLAKPHVSRVWGRVSKADVRATLAGGNPVLIGIEVHPDFESLNSDNPTYDDYSGKSNGNHAITLLGYDDNRQAFKFINSWGTDRGIGGYGYISYTLVNDNVREFYTMEDVVEKATLSSIAITTPPSKTSYMVGEVFSSVGISITAYYSDGSYHVVNGWTLSRPNMSQVGAQTVTVSYVESAIVKTTAFKIAVAPQVAKLASISIDSQPTKTTYKVGEAFGTTGMIVSATYSDGSNHAISGWTTSLPNMNFIGTQSVSVNYVEDGITRATSFSIFISAQVATLSSISISSPPTKTNYKVGEAFSTTGMIVSATYSDGSTHAISGWTTSLPNMNFIGTQSVSVNYVENGATRSTSFTIAITTQVTTLTSIAVWALPTLTTYNVGDTFSSFGMVVTAIYSDNSSHAVSGWTTSSPNMNRAGTQGVLVTYTENGVVQTASFNITILSAPQLATINVSSDKVEDSVSGQFGITFTIRTYDQSGNAIDISDTWVNFSPLGQVQVQRLGVGTYSYKLQSPTPVIVNNGFVSKSGIQSNTISYKFFKWAIKEPLPFNSGSVGNLMNVTDIYLNWVWVPTILVKKNNGAAFVYGGKISLYRGTYSSGIEDSYRIIENTGTTSVELSFDQPGTYYVTSGSMYVGMFTIVKKYQ